MARRPGYEGDVQPTRRLRDHLQDPHADGHDVRRCRRRSGQHRPDRSVRVTGQGQSQDSDPAQPDQQQVTIASVSFHVLGNEENENQQI